MALMLLPLPGGEGWHISLPLPLGEGWHLHLPLPLGEGWGEGGKGKWR